MNIIVTGCAGFIGSHTCEELVRNGHNVVGIDTLTYAGNLRNIYNLDSRSNFAFIKCDINDTEILQRICCRENITYVINFAAETHVDNSISDVKPFISSNIMGVSSLIDVARNTGTSLVHISTDEVYGVPHPGEIFDTDSPLSPRNPYSATKAAADHLIIAAINTHKIAAKIIRPSNNFGPRQHSEKFIPTIVRSVKNLTKIPVYGDGSNLREWTYVKDTAKCISNSIEDIFKSNKIIFNLSSENQLSNLEVISAVCRSMKVSPEDYINFVPDRPGHDREYRIRNTILSHITNFDVAIDQTVKGEFF